MIAMKAAIDEVMSLGVYSKRVELKWSMSNSSNNNFKKQA